jgi:hypothetical protein
MSENNPPVHHATTHTEKPHPRPTLAPNHSGAAAARSAGRPHEAHVAGDKATVTHASEPSGSAHHSVGSLISGLLGGPPHKTQAHGVTTVHEPGGRTVESWHRNGAQVQRTSFTSHGASVTQTRATLRNGTVVENEVMRRESVVDRTTSVSRRVDEPIDRVVGKQGRIDPVPVPGDPSSKQRVPAFAAAGEARSPHGTTMVTDVRYTVQDTSAPHSKPVTVDAFMSYRQSDARPHDPELRCEPNASGPRDVAGALRSPRQIERPQLCLDGEPRDQRAAERHRRIRVPEHGQLQDGQRPHGDHHRRERADGAKRAAAEADALDDGAGHP